MTRPEPGASCDLVGCPLVCGAVFHQCKASEHQLLCPLERVPCLNSGFGCPFTLPRARLAAHLLLCPASVVCCTMEWNRWPVSYADHKSYEHLSCSGEAEPVEQLDMALALQDQRMLLESLRVTTTVNRPPDDDLNTERLSSPLIQEQPVQQQQQLLPQLPQQQSQQRPSQVELARGLMDMRQESYSELYKASVETSRSLAAALDILTSANKEIDQLMDSLAEKEQCNGTTAHRHKSNGECRHAASDGMEVKENSDTESDGDLGAVGGIDLNQANGLGWEAHNGFCKSIEVIVDGKLGDMEDREVQHINPWKKEKPLRNGGFHHPESASGHHHWRSHHRLQSSGQNGSSDCQPELLVHSRPLVVMEPAVPQHNVTVSCLALPVQKAVPHPGQLPLATANSHLTNQQEEESCLNGNRLQPLMVLEGEELMLNLGAGPHPSVVAEEELQDSVAELPPLVMGEELEGVELQPVVMVEEEDEVGLGAAAEGPQVNGDGMQEVMGDIADRWLERKLHNLQALPGVFNFNGRRALISDPYHMFRAKMEDKAVDTSDLEVSDDPMGLHGIDLITAALLFCLGDSPGGRGISDSRFVDGYRMDFGTQTFSFPSAILATNTMVGDIASASACDHASPQLSNPSPFHTLRLDLVLECVARYQTKQRSMFTFVCGQLFRRDEFSSHFKNVHGDIHAGLNGWMEQRCPLAYYGCTYSQRRFCPSIQGSRIVHDRHLGSFGVQLGTPILPLPSRKSLFRNGYQYGNQHDFLSSLPFELLQHVASFLDGFSLCQLSRVSRTMRDVCASLLQGRGMVVLLWQKVRQPDGSNSWQIKDKIWRFSTAFGTVNEWKFANISSMADHLKTCKFNTVARREEAIPLPCMCFTRKLTREGRSLRSVLKPVL